MPVLQLQQKTGPLLSYSDRPLQYFCLAFFSSYIAKTETQERVATHGISLGCAIPSGTGATLVKDATEKRDAGTCMSWDDSSGQQTESCRVSFSVVLMPFELIISIKCLAMLRKRRKYFAIISDLETNKKEVPDVLSARVQEVWLPVSQREETCK